MQPVRTDFPIFEAHPGLIYLDSASTTQKPAIVIDTVAEFYRTKNANIHRGLYPLSEDAELAFEGVRERARDFIGASSVREVIFTSGATEGINLLAATLGSDWQAGDSLIVSELEHHANLVPWQQLASRKGMSLKYVRLDEQGAIDLDHLRELADERTRLIALAHCSNTLGTVVPAKEVAAIAHGAQALFVLDASQSIPHFPVNVTDLGCDFLVFSGHKLYGPSGTGVLWGREALLQRLPPYQTGGDMIRTVTQQEATWNELPWKFEAGTPNIEGIIGLGAALSYLKSLGMEQVAEHTKKLTAHALSRLESIPGLIPLGKPDPRSGIVSFVFPDIHAHDLAALLAGRGVCIRAGHHCAAPLHASLEVVASCRFSFGIYTTQEEIDRAVTILGEVVEDYRRV